MRPVFCTLRKLTNMPCAVSGRRYIVDAPSAVDPICVENIRLNCLTSVQLRVPDMGAYDLAVEDYLAQLVKVVGIQSLGETLVHGVALGCDIGHARRGGTVLLLVEGLAEALARLLHLLGDLLVLLGEPILDQHVGTVTLLRVAVVDKRIVERADMSRSLPRAGGA